MYYFHDELVDHQHILDNGYDYEYVDLACESNRTLILVKFKNKNYNELFSIGEKNIILNESENNFLDENHLIRIKDLNFEKLRIMKIYAKKNTALFVTEDNSIYIRGTSFCNYEDEKFYPISLNFEKEILSIELGIEHILLLTSNIHLFELFYNNNKIEKDYNKNLWTILKKNMIFLNNKFLYIIFTYLLRVK